MNTNNQQDDQEFGAPPFHRAPQLAQDRAKPSTLGCPICDGVLWEHLFSQPAFHTYRCTGCNVFRCDPAAGRLKTSGASLPTEEFASFEDKTFLGLARQCIEALQADGVPGGRLLVIGSENHPFVAAARGQGYALTVSSQVDSLDGAQAFDACVILTFEEFDDPRNQLRALASKLPTGALLVVLTGLTDSWLARRLGSNWYAWSADCAFYYDRSQIHSLLMTGGYGDVWFRKVKRRPTIAYLLKQLGLVDYSLIKLLGTIGKAVFPESLKRLRLPTALPTAKSIITARVAGEESRPALSILVPTYNERVFFPELMRRLLDKVLPGVTREIIIVESNSTDGTRELVRGYEGHSDVRVIYEERPQGKGHAVRAALAHARGDIVIIQDADLEYDIDDYDALLKPLLAKQQMFILGSRHRGNWKIRKFETNPLKATVLNLAHWIIAGMINVLYRQKLTDPFTMYKIFYRDCAYGLHLECNLFDFDHEILIKLIRKGYTPLEIPVNYASRSFAEGKKIRFLRDGLTGIWADIKYRFAPISKKR